MAQAAGDLTRHLYHLLNLFSGQREHGGLEILGSECFKSCLEDYPIELHAIASSLDGFFSNLDGLAQHSKWRSKEGVLKSQIPNFRCAMEAEGTFILHINTPRTLFPPYISGIIKAASDGLFKKPAFVEKMSTQSVGKHALRVNCRTLKDRYIGSNSRSALSHHTSPVSAELPLSVETFSRSFPFHLVIDRNMQLTQLVVKLLKTIRAEMCSLGTGFFHYFRILQPSVGEQFEDILERINTCFELECLQQHKPTEDDSVQVSPGNSISHVTS